MCVFSPNEAKLKLPLKVSASLAQVLEKLDLSKKAEKENQGESVETLFSRVLEHITDFNAATPLKLC